MVLKERRTLSWRVHCTDRANGRDAFSNAIAVDVTDVSRLLKKLFKGDLDFLIGKFPGSTPET